MADGTPVTATVRNGGLTPSGPGAAEEWLAFNAFVRRVDEWKGRTVYVGHVLGFFESFPFFQIERRL